MLLNCLDSDMFFFCLVNISSITHILFRWHLGFCNLRYTPTERGFDSFMGYYNGGEDYYTHEAGRGPST